jgi:histidinol-phosphate aminotransferase
MSRFDHLAHPHIRGLDPYVPGQQPGGGDWIKLNTNELPYPPPEAVRVAVLHAVDGLARYPNPQSRDLREAIARKFGWPGEGVIVGNGSDDILNLLVRVFGGAGRRTVQADPSYSLYPVLTVMAGGRIVSCPFDASFALPVECLVNSRPDLCFVTCPHAPTGRRFEGSLLQALAERIDGLLVIDEAYAEFAEGSALEWAGAYPNVVVTRTFSKAYGLAGLRVGYALGDPSVIALLDRVRDSYNVNRLSQAGALAALRETAWYEARIAEIKVRRDRVRQALRDLGWSVHPFETNFLLGAPVNPAGEASPELAASLFHFLEQEKILVRSFPNNPLTASSLRISIGSELEMEAFLGKVRLWTQSARA